MKPEVAIRHINLFEQRFGDSHLYLACHAAFPLALTPELLYGLWANFQRDIHGNPLNIPWVAVADLLLSNLCDEVGNELYEMDRTVRNELLKRLKANENFSRTRLLQLSDFLLEYVRQQLYSDDPDTQDFAQSQQWTALAYTQPSETARQLALTFRQLGWNTSSPEQMDKTELVRMASLVETLAEPLLEEGFEPLLIYARGMASFARNDLEMATVQLAKVVEAGKLEVAGVDLPIPEAIEENLEDPSLPPGPDYHGKTLRGRSFRGQNLTRANFSHTDIRSADFTDAILLKADFSEAQAGLQRRWATALLLCAFLLSTLSGMMAASVGWIWGVEFNLGNPVALMTGIGSVVGFVLACLMAFRKGLEIRVATASLAAVGIASLAAFEILTGFALVNQAGQYNQGGVSAIALLAGIIIAGAAIGIGARLRKQALAVTVLLGGVGAVIGSAGAIATWLWAGRILSLETVALIFAVALTLTASGLIAVAIAGTWNWRFALGTVAVATIAAMVWFFGQLSFSSGDWLGTIWLGILTGVLACAIVATVAVALTLTWTEAGNVWFATAWTLAVFLFGISIWFLIVLVGWLGVYPPFRITEDLIPIGLAAIVIASLGVYVGRQSLRGDPKFALIRDLAIAFTATGGTQFRGADLTNVNFTQATLKNADFRNAKTQRTRWLQTIQLEFACADRTYQQQLKVQQLLTKEGGSNKNFDNLDLQGINLRGAKLTDASFIRTNLKQANLRGADLSRAKLVQTQLDQADLTGSRLTGAYIQDWKITSTTKLKGVECDYIYTRLPTKDNPDPGRVPENHRELFKPGDFVDFLKVVS